MICVVSVAIVGVEVIFPLQWILGADPCLSAGNGQVLQSKLPIPTWHENLDTDKSQFYTPTQNLPSNLAKKTASPRYM